MSAGKLDQQIVITRKNVTGVDSIGGDVLGTPTTVGTFWASVRFMAGRELFAVQQRWAEARYEICMRRQPGITIRAADTITWNSQTLDILDIQGQGTRMPEWKITARDHVA